MVIGLVPLGYLILFGYTWILMHHMLGGVRHLVWDFGHGMEPKIIIAATIAFVMQFGAVDQRHGAAMRNSERFDKLRPVAGPMHVARRNALHQETPGPVISRKKT